MLLQLEFDTNTSHTLADARTFAIGTQLLLRRIHTVQLDSHTLMLEDSRDATFACAIISADPHVKRFKIVGL